VFFQFNKIFSSLVEQSQFERACCLALLTQNYDKALEILENANKEGKLTFLYFNNFFVFKADVFY
jgi:hypothetical protein